MQYIEAPMVLPMDLKRNPPCGYSGAHKASEFFNPVARVFSRSALKERSVCKGQSSIL
jgi:hypothetical protein